jgi:hypothetical protein
VGCNNLVSLATRASVSILDVPLWQEWCSGHEQKCRNELHGNG